MDPNFPDNFAAFAGLGIIFVIVYLVVTALLILLAIWIQYSIVWRAVRRGMREFHYGGKDAPQTLPPAP